MAEPSFPAGRTRDIRVNARTVVRPGRVRGRGLFRRGPVELQFRPAAPGTGLVFTRPRNRGLPAAIRHARAGRHCTVLTRGRFRVRAVEHLLATCLGLGITDIELDCPAGEPPFGDGSSRQFVRALARAGFRDRVGGPRPLTVRKALIVKTGRSLALVRPASGLSLTCITEFPWSGPEQADWTHGPGSFERGLADARTVAYTSESMDRLRRTLGLRFGLRRCAGFVIPARPRMAGEACRHKLLDLLGDLALLGRPLAVEVIAVRPSHRFNLELVRRLTSVADEPDSRGELAL